MIIRVQITRDGSNRIITLPIEEYLSGVVPAEMPSRYPAEALKAQAVAARTYALGNINLRANEPYHVDDTTRYQAYKPNWINNLTDAAAKATKGEVLHYKEELIDTCVYCNSNGGRTVSSKKKWGGHRDYLIEKDDPYTKRSGVKKDSHGVGMSQVGARQMALVGKTYKEILSFYYPGTELKMEDDLMQEIKAQLESLQTAYSESDKVHNELGSHIKSLEKLINEYEAPKPEPEPQPLKPLNDKQITEHFWFWEARCKSGVDLPNEYIPNAVETASVAELIRAVFKKPVHRVSWYRTPEHNEKIGGAKNSRHMYGGAIDIYIDGVSTEELARVADGIIGNRGGVGIYDKFVHIDLGQPDMRGIRRRWDERSEARKKIEKVF